MPGGFCDIALSPLEHVVKEIREESGHEVVPVKLLALLVKNKHEHPPEAYNYYFSKENLPDLSINRNTEYQIRGLFDIIEHPSKEAIFD